VHKFKPDTEGELVWCTDRSKIGKGAGTTVLRWDSRRRQHSFPLGLDTAVFQAELYVIKVCVMEDVVKGYTGRSIFILSGSQAAIKALDIFQMKSKLVWDCRHLLMRLTECKRIQLVWVLGHMGNGWK
jgi:RNase H.